MPILLRNIEARILDNFMSDIVIFGTIDASIQFEDYIRLNAFTAYLQNFTRAEIVSFLDKPITFGLKNQYHLPITTLEMDYEPNVFGLNWITTVNNPCSSTPWVISNGNKTIRYNIVDSLNCGGTCNVTQAGTATAYITVGKKQVLMDLDFIGIGELEDPDYEKIEFYLDGTLIARAQASGGGLGCSAFGPVTKEYLVPSPYPLAANTIHTLFIDFTTNDGQYHVGCYYEVNLDFITS
jgi:hypothetical protein